MYDDYDESNDERLEREAREGLEERLRARGFKGKAPLAVVQEPSPPSSATSWRATQT